MNVDYLQLQKGDDPALKTHQWIRQENLDPLGSLLQSLLTQPIRPRTAQYIEKPDIQKQAYGHII